MKRASVVVRIILRIRVIIRGRIFVAFSLRVNAQNSKSEFKNVDE